MAPGSQITDIVRLLSSDPLTKLSPEDRRSAPPVIPLRAVTGAAPAAARFQARYHSHPPATTHPTARRAAVPAPRFRSASPPPASPPTPTAKSSAPRPPASSMGSWKTIIDNPTDSRPGSIPWLMFCKIFPSAVVSPK